MGKKSRSGFGIRIRDEHPGSYIRELRNNFLGQNTYIPLCGCGSGSGNIFWRWDPGWKKFGFGIRGKHPRSATLHFACLDPGQIWTRNTVLLWFFYYLEFRIHPKATWLIAVRVSDPHWFNADPDTDPDPEFFLIADPDSGSGSRIRIPDPDPGSGSRIRIPDPDPRFDDLKLNKTYN